MINNRSKEAVYIIALANIRERVTKLDKSRLRSITMNLPISDVVDVGLFTMLKYENCTVAHSSAALKNAKMIFQSICTQN